MVNYNKRRSEELFMKKIKENKWMPIVISCLLIVVGVLTFIFSLVNIDVVDHVISYSIAASLFIVGLIYILSSLIGHTVEFFTGSLILGSLSIAIGIVLCITPHIMGGVLTYFAGALLLTLGLVLAIKSVLLIVYKQKVSWIILFIASALVCITGGILVFCYSGEAKLVLYCIMGVVIVLAGTLCLILAIKANNKGELENKDEKPEDK